MKKQALVTGSAKRIGQSIALSLALSGYDIALHYNKSKTDAQNTCRYIREMGRLCHSFQADLFNIIETENMMKNVLQQYSDLSVLINSASYFQKNTLSSSSIREVEKNFLIHLLAPLKLIQLFTQNRSKGLIINFLDTHIVKNRNNYAGYYLSKRSLADLTRMAAFEYAPNYRINAIAPGHVLPPVDGSSVNSTTKKSNLLQKGISLESINSTVKYLIENRDITGQIIYVDGGESISWQ
jgi:NAD(P)-dependent dehydrogenase (short-subunit alcohol dehydrogenase family)